MGIQVTKKKNESVERLISRFKKKVKDSNMLFELKQREFYTKPSTLRREAKRKRVLHERNQEEFHVKTHVFNCLYIFI